jgi:hypothetical protein
LASASGARPAASRKVGQNRLPDPRAVAHKIASDRDYYTRMVAPVGAVLTQVCRRMVAGVDLTMILEPAEQVAAYLNPDPDLDRVDWIHSCWHYVDDRCPGCAVCTVCADCLCADTGDG